MEEQILWQYGKKTNIYRCTWCGYALGVEAEVRKGGVARGQTTLGFD
jgi:hypothetical protein